MCGDGHLWRAAPQMRVLVEWLQSLNSAAATP